MAGVYLCPTGREHDFEKAVKANKLPNELDFGLKTDSRFFYYVLDVDNAESSTGIYEIVSYGAKAPVELRQLAIG